MWDSFYQSLFSPLPVMGIFRGHGLDKTLQMCHAAWDAGVKAVEIPVMDETDLHILQVAVEHGRERGKVVGAGTITSTKLLDQASACGAGFTVAPGFDVEVVAASISADLPHLPGVATPSDVGAGIKMGLTWLKQFPASVLGSAWISALHGPFPGVNFVATGGIDATNMQEFLDAGAAAVSLGSAFADADSVAAVVSQFT